MTTATEIRDKTHDDEVLNMLIQHFIERYSPADPYARSGFEMSLHQIVRAIYKEAAKPYEKILRAGFELSQQVTPQTIFVKEPKS